MMEESNQQPADFGSPPPASAAPPPPVQPPPVIVPPTPPSRPRSGRGWMVVALILFVLLVFSGLYNLGNFTSSLFRSNRHYSAGKATGPRLEESLLEDKDSNDKIAVIEVNGIITSRSMDQGGYNMVEILKAQLKRAGEDNKVKAVILKVDSPGGEVLASDEIYHAIADFQTKENKPVVASMGNLAASGGYYISAPCQWIVANELTITGSIGVIMHSWNYFNLMKKVGVAPQTYKSGKFKDMLSGERDPDSIAPEEREMVQGLIDETYNKFKSVVAEGRKTAHDKNKGADNRQDQGRALTENWADYADGRVLSGTEAYKLGFVDQLGSFDVAVKRTEKIAGIKDANLIQYEMRYDLSDIFKMFGKSEPPAIKVDLGVEPPKLQAGQLYFLSPTFTH
jgi:protease-4